MKAKGVKISQRRVNELVALRLETLARKQRLRSPVRKRPLSVKVTNMLAGNPRLAAALALASNEDRQRKGSLSMQTKTRLIEICRFALLSRRRSLKPAFCQVGFYRLARDSGGGIEGLPPRVRETGPAMRCLDRSEALLLRLVHGWAKREARKEQEAEQAQKQAHAQEQEADADGH